MREAATTISLIIFIIWGGLFFTNKVASSPAAIDHIRDNFSGIEYIIAPANNLSVNIKYVDSADYVRLFCLVRFALVPIHLSLNPSKYDTVLTIYGKPPTSAEVQPDIKNRRLLWKYVGSDHLFIITAPQK